MTQVVSALLLLSSFASTAPAAEGWCQSARITAYVRGEYSPWTFDGTSIWEEGIAAASWNIPIGSLVDVENYGTVRIADRGVLGSSGWIDIAVNSRAEAFALTSWRTICVRPPA
jgi:3D (Asp-Asp-Asp) domain-containing protein